MMDLFLSPVTGYILIVAVVLSFTAVALCGWKDFSGGGTPKEAIDAQESMLQWPQPQERIPNEVGYVIGKDGSLMTFLMYDHNEIEYRITM